MRRLFITIFLPLALVGCDTLDGSESYADPDSDVSCSIQEEEIDELLRDLEDRDRELAENDAKIIGMSKEIYNILNCNRASSSNTDLDSECTE